MIMVSSNCERGRESDIATVLLNQVIDIAKNALNMGLQLDDIIKLTGLTREEV